MYLPRSLSSFITAAYAESGDFTLTGTSGSVTLTAVPAGTIRVITNLCGWNASGTSGRNTIKATIGGVGVTLMTLNSAVRWEGNEAQGLIVLEDGDSVGYFVAGATLGDVLHCDAVGYDIKSESS